jgi:hypothetical protein
MWHSIKFILMGVLLTILTASNAFAEDAILIEGKGEGIFCGQEIPEHVYTCVKQNGKERSLVGNPKNAAEEKALEKMRKGTPVTFEFEVVRAYHAGEDGQETMVTYVQLVGMRAK